MENANGRTNTECPLEAISWVNRWCCATALLWQVCERLHETTNRLCWSTLCAQIQRRLKAAPMQNIRPSGCSNRRVNRFQLLTVQLVRAAQQHGRASAGSPSAVPERAFPSDRSNEHAWLQACSPRDRNWIQFNLKLSAINVQRKAKHFLMSRQSEWVWISKWDPKAFDKTHKKLWTQGYKKSSMSNMSCRCKSDKP